MNEEWYALRVRTRCEARVSCALSLKGYETFLPTYFEKVGWSDRTKTREFPLFPGYLFCSLDREARLPVVGTPGVLDVVGCGNQYLPIPQQELAAIRMALDAALRVRPSAEFGKGDLVRIQRGPLAGVVGEVVRIKTGLRLVLRVTLLSRAVAVDLDLRWVQQAIPMRAAYIATMGRAS